MRWGVAQETRERASYTEISSLFKKQILQQMREEEIRLNETKGYASLGNIIKLASRIVSS